MDFANVFDFLSKVITPGAVGSIGTLLVTEYFRGRRDERSRQGKRDDAEIAHVRVADTELRRAYASWAAANTRLGSVRVNFYNCVIQKLKAELESEAEPRSETRRFALEQSQDATNKLSDQIHAADKRIEYLKHKLLLIETDKGGRARIRSVDHIVPSAAMNRQAFEKPEEANEAFLGAISFHQARMRLIDSIIDDASEHREIGRPARAGISLSNLPDSG